MLNSEINEGEKNRDNHRDNYDSSDDSDFADMIEPNAFDKTIGHIEDLLIDNTFQQLQVDFLNKYWHLFEDSEENKLIYTAVFNEYVRTMEDYIENYLKTVINDFDLEVFLEQISQRRNILDGEVFEMLFSLSDFLIFKEMMLDFKAAKEGKTADFSEDLLVTPISVED